MSPAERGAPRGCWHQTWPVRDRGRGADTDPEPRPDPDPDPSPHLDPNPDPEPVPDPNLDPGPTIKPDSNPHPNLSPTQTLILHLAPTPTLKPVLTLTLRLILTLNWSLSFTLILNLILALKPTPTSSLTQSLTFTLSPTPVPAWTLILSLIPTPTLALTPSLPWWSQCRFWGAAPGRGLGVSHGGWGCAYIPVGPWGVPTFQKTVSKSVPWNFSGMPEVESLGPSNVTNSSKSTCPSPVGHRGGCHPLPGQGGTWDNSPPRKGPMGGHRLLKPVGDPRISWEPPANLENFQLWPGCPTLDGL